MINPRHPQPLIIALSLLANFACSSEQHEIPASQAELELPYDEALYEISPLLALREMGLSASRSSHCSMHQIISKEATERALEGPTAQALSAVAEESRVLCEIFRLTEVSAATVFENARASGAVPIVFSFSITNPAASNEELQERAIGPFPDVAACEQVEAFAREQRLFTRRCQRE